MSARGKMIVKAAASLAVTAACVYYAFHGVDRHAVELELRRLPVTGVLLYFATLAVTNFFRAARWEYLLRPVGVSVPLRRLLLLSAVGFMAIFALPVRLGELVRPYYVAREGRARMSVAVGTVAVERIIDLLALSILFFVSYATAAPGVFSAKLRFAAWLSLLGSIGLMTFLGLALVSTEWTIRFVLKATLLDRIMPRRAAQVGERIRALISGFHALGDPRNLVMFLAQTVAYWGANGLGMWLLARQMGLPISVGVAFTVMALTGVVLSLPNSPGLVGQFHAGIKAGLEAFLPLAVVNSKGIAYAVVLHGLQAAWFVTTGLLALPFASRGGGRGSSLADAMRGADAGAGAAGGSGTGTRDTAGAAEAGPA